MTVVGGSSSTGAVAAVSVKAWEIKDPIQDRDLKAVPALLVRGPQQRLESADAGGLDEVDGAVLPDSEPAGDGNPVDMGLQDVSANRAAVKSRILFRSLKSR